MATQVKIFKGYMQLSDDGFATVKSTQPSTYYNDISPSLVATDRVQFARQKKVNDEVRTEYLTIAAIDIVEIDGVPYSSSDAAQAAADAAAIFFLSSGGGGSTSFPQPPIFPVGAAFGNQYATIQAAVDAAEAAGYGLAATPYSIWLEPSVVYTGATITNGNVSITSIDGLAIITGDLTAVLAPTLSVFSLTGNIILDGSLVVDDVAAFSLNKRIYTSNTTVTGNILLGTNEPLSNVMVRHENLVLLSSYVINRVGTANNLIRNIVDSFLGNDITTTIAANENFIIADSQIESGNLTVNDGDLIFTGCRRISSGASNVIAAGSLSIEGCPTFSFAGDVLMDGNLSIVDSRIDLGGLFKENTAGNGGTVTITNSEFLTAYGTDGTATIVETHEHGYETLTIQAGAPDFVDVNAIDNNNFFVDADTGGVAYSFQVNNPTNCRPGLYNFVIKQNGAGSVTVTFDTQFQPADGATYVTVDDDDELMFQSYFDGTVHRLSFPTTYTL